MSWEWAGCEDSRSELFPEPASHRLVLKDVGDDVVSVSEKTLMRPLPAPAG